MARSKCRECGSQVSTKAKHCPQCGAKAPRKTSKFVWVLAALIGYVFYLGVQGNLPSSSPATTAALQSEQQAKIEAEAKIRAQKSFENETIYSAKKAVKRLLKDSDSAKFRGIFFNETKTGGAVACGQVNSKNSFGVYSGFQRFISNGKTTFLEEKTKDFSNIWKSACFTE